MASAVQSNMILSVVLRDQAIASADTFARGALRIKSLTFGFKYMVATRDLLLRKASTAPDVADTDWPRLLLGFLVSQLHSESARGAIYAQLEHARTPIQFFVSSEGEQMLTKKGIAEKVAECQLIDFLRFLRYLNGTLLGEEITSMGCGLLRITFDDDRAVRLFRLYAGSSSKVGCFFQMDRFEHNL